VTRLREWLFRARALLRGRRWAAEKREELQFHLDMEIEAGLRDGLSPAAARRRARLRVGPVADGVEATREAIGFRILDGAALDLRHAARALRRSRGFGVVAVLVLAASVAITTVLFCLLENVVLRPLPYAAPDRLVRVFDDDGRRFTRFPVSIGHFLDLRAHARTLASIALYTGRDVELTALQGASRRLTGVAVTSDFFTVLGRPPLLGRGFTEADLRGAARSVVISHRLWQDRFRGDPTIVGRTLRLDREPWTIVGVAAPGLQHVGGDYRSPLQGETVDVWLPLALDLPERALRNFHYTNAVARLAAGVTEAQAGQELALLAARYAARFPGGGWTLRARPLLAEVTGRSRELLWLLVAAGGLVLLLACANIAGLSVARAVARGRELALRQALGANRWQLLRVGLVENLLVGCLGAILGIALAAAAVPVLRRLLPADFPRAHEVAFTPAAALLAAAVALATALVAGLLPWGRRRALAADPRLTSDRDTRKLRAALVVGELALAGLLSAGCLFLLRSFQQIHARDHGFQPAGALTFQLTIPGEDRVAFARVEDAILEKIRAVPGVAAAGAATNLPWSGWDENTGFGIVGGATDEDHGPNARFQAASPGAFEALGMRLVAGRTFDRTRDGPGQPLVVVVNDALANRYFPNDDAVGRALDLWGEKRTIVGVVGGIADLPADLEVKPAFWFPLAQQSFGSVFVAVRGAGVDPASLTSAVAAAVHAVDPDLPLADVRTLEQRVAGALAARRFALSLLESFAALALVLSAAGVYALLAYLVQQRRKELGVRAALGATRADLARLILGDGLKLAAAAAGLSLVTIPIAGWLMQAFLYQVRPLDAFTIAGAPAALLCAALLASLGPARTATRGDPAMVLRED
jgi:putative ABC transport system permease protein